MSRLVNNLHSTELELIRHVDFLIKSYFEDYYPQKLKKWHGKKIIPLYEWDKLYTSGVDKFFDYLPAEKTDSLPKYYHINLHDEKKLDAWYRDFSEYMFKIELQNDS